MDTLQRLLTAETKAESLVDEAEQERDRITAAASAEARREQQRFEARIPELHASFVGKAEDHARQSIAELELRYTERTGFLREQADERRGEAIQAALQILLDPEQI